MKIISEKRLLKNNVFICLIINSIAFISSILFFGLRYETYDDVAMMINAYKGSSFMYFSNYLVGIINSFLFGICNSFNWYAFLHYLLSFISANIISYILLKRIKEKKLHS